MKSLFRSTRSQVPLVARGIQMFAAVLCTLIFTTLNNASFAFAATGQQFAATGQPQESPATVVAASYQAMDNAMNSGNVVRHPQIATQTPSNLLAKAQARVETSAAGTSLYQYDLKRVSDVRAWAALHTSDYSAVNIWSTFKTQSVTTQGSTSQVIGDEILHIDATVKDNGQRHTVSPRKAAIIAQLKNTSSYIGVGQTNHGMALIHHTVTLHQTNGSWMIQSDQYRDPVESKFEADHHTILPPAAPQGLRSHSVLPSAFVSPLTTAVYNYTYLRSKAIAYADTWWNSCNSNPDYNCYMSQGVDCANFVSQSIYDASGGNIPADSYWESELALGIPPTYDFVNASGLYSYAISNPYGSTYNISANNQAETTNYSTAQWNDYEYESPGDLIFYDWVPTSGNQNHVAISVAHDVNMYTYVDAHTENMYHWYWDMGNVNNGTGFFFVELKNNGTSHQ